jgi:hypothetical protein
LIFIFGGSHVTGTTQSLDEPLKTNYTDFVKLFAKIARACLFNLPDCFKRTGAQINPD